MPSAAEALRSALERFLSGEHAAHLQRLRDPGDDQAPPTREQGRWLLSERAVEALREARESGALDAEQSRAMQAQLAAAGYRLALAPAELRLRRALASATLPSGGPLSLPQLVARLASADDHGRRALAARELEQVLLPPALDYLRAQLQAEAPLRVAQPVPAPVHAAEVTPAGQGLLVVSAFSVEALTSPPARDLPDTGWLGDAHAFLERTDAAAHDAVRHALRAFRPGARIDWHLLLRGLRAPELDSRPAADARWRRVAGWLRGLGFGRELDARLRAQVDRGGALPLASVIAPAPPRDVRVAQIALDYGVASDVLATDGVAGALGLALAAPALPPELRWPIAGSTAGALGALGLQLHGERQHLTRVHGLGAAEAERVGRLAGTLALLYARAWVALALAPPGLAEQAPAQAELLAELLGRALCCQLPPGIASLLGADRVRARARAEELLAGLALHPALRERFDLDWFRNPRSAELLRGMCAPGAALAPGVVCAELGSPLSAAAARALELVT